MDGYLSKFINSKNVCVWLGCCCIKIDEVKERENNLHNLIVFHIQTKVKKKKPNFGLKVTVSILFYFNLTYQLYIYLYVIHDV